MVIESIFLPITGKQINLYKEVLYDNDGDTAETSHEIHQERGRKLVAAGKCYS